jgi:hypothetical protein
MKTLIEKTEEYAKFEFSNESSKKIVIYKIEKIPDINLPFKTQNIETISDVDHENWLEWLNAKKD